MFWKKKETYEVEVKCNHCSVVDTLNSRFNFEVKIGDTPIGKKATCDNCGIEGEIILGTGRDGIDRLYLANYHNALEIGGCEQVMVKKEKKK